ncbi:serine/arginine-rich splicing factor 6 isoform X1 [Hydra vulgaris]|uniref:serine/arginine-rich splicing factor 6 isoform X1 n=1 Tax=Hydra vulgaris TaxID=6087 RepID=UPI00019263E0|nr:serine/arginine-rich splicing factor 6 [Hydra vulgaris]
MPRLYVGRLNNRVIERDLKKFFDNYGKIRDIMMKNGYAFVDFDDYRDADDAVYDLNGKELMGDRVIIEHAKGIERGSGGAPYGRERFKDDRSGFGRKQRARDKYGPPVRTKWMLRVENLSSRVSWQDLKDYCRPHAEVTYADAHRKERGVACICTSTYEDMKNLIRKIDNTELNGKKIRVLDDRGSASRSRSRSRSRQKSRSVSRSRSRSRSRSKREKSRSKSRSKSKSRSRSPEPVKSGERSRSRSRSSPKRSRSRSR